MFIGDVLNSGALPSLELTMRFAGQRQRLLAHNIANLTTPNFRPLDVSPREFQKELARAIDERREQTGGTTGDLALRETPQLRRTTSGELALVPEATDPGLLRHDRNSSNLERLMQDHAENANVYRVSAELLRSRLQQIRDAIAERP